MDSTKVPVLDGQRATITNTDLIAHGEVVTVREYVPVIFQYRVEFDNGAFEGWVALDDMCVYSTSPDSLYNAKGELNFPEGSFVKDTFDHIYIVVEQDPDFHMDGMLVGLFTGDLLHASMLGDILAVSRKELADRLLSIDPREGE
ncbi:MAG: hypothetical protein DRH08_05830 [Deltaproteobacteria bacterium]|nr:MAG: hypothetical protein DRH08_05830 [Deltaproteobacteria bacterium]